MSGLQDWAIGLCAAAMACTALLLLLPAKSTSPLMRTLLAVFFCCCLMGPIGMVVATDWTSLLPAVDPAETQAEQMEQAFYGTLQIQADGVLKQLAEDALSPAGYSVKKIRANWTESVDGGIYMSGATAWLDKEQTAHAVEIGTRLNATIGIPVTVVPDLG